MWNSSNKRTVSFDEPEEFNTLPVSINREVQGFDTIVAGVYHFKDACNVYLLKSGNSAILIDAGTGKMAGHLKDAGITSIDWILHTHYHRDQCTGDSKLKDYGAKIAIGSQRQKI